MNGEIPSVPITTLAGVCSLTDLLTELPLPTPLPHTMNNKSLLYHPKVADDARQLLGCHDDVLVSQLTKALKHSSSEHIELKDNMANDTIEGEVPELLKAILAKDPNVFKARSSTGYVDQTGGRQGMGGYQPYPTHNQQPSPYQAGQISPCPPGSPARLAPQPGGGSYGGQTSSYPPIAGFSQNAATSKYQQQFLNFAGASDGPTVNGGVSGSPGSHGALTPPHSHPVRAARHSKPATVSSPAQAAAAPPPSESAGLLGPPFPSHHSNQGNNQSEVRSSRHKSSTKSAEPVVVLEPLDGAALSLMSRPTVLLTRLEMTHGDVMKVKRDDKSHKKSRYDDKRGSKRHRRHDDDDFTSSSSDRSKRRRYSTTNYIESDSDGAPAVSDDDYVEPKRAASPEIPKKKRREKHKHKVIADERLTTDDLMETATFKKFYSIVDAILDSSEDLDFGALNADDDDGGGVGGSDSAVTRHQLEKLSNEAAKLKAMNVTKEVPSEKLVKLLAILQLSIRDGSKALPFSHNDADHDSEALLREITLERVTTAVDAAMVGLYIMTSKGMPKEVFIEDVIERIVMMAKFQLQNTIFPEFDPVYRVDPSKAAYQANIKSKRARASQAKHRDALNLYNKLTELVCLIAELVDVQELTDTIILQLSTLAVTPFFVENISELQLNSLKLVTSVFTRYEKHRQLIMEDILSSLARLPTSKKNLRSYRLNSEENIQMLTALALQLIQCIVRLPDPPAEERAGDDDNAKPRKADMVDKEVVIMTSYETAMRNAHNFLVVFLNKCSTKGDEDYRPLFEHFVYDLLATVNKPEWPAAELILSLLGRLLVAQFSSKSVDMPLRVASLDYLGIVAARLRKDAVTSRLNEDTIREIIGQIHDSDDEDSTTRKTRKSEGSEETQHDPEANKTQHLQKALLEYLEYHAQSDPALVFARQFYVAQWYRDASVEVDKIAKQQSAPKTDKDADALAEEMERAQQATDNAERRKQALFEHISQRRIGVFTTYKPSPSKLDYDNSCLVARYLASTRPFSQSFDIYLTQILKVLCETAVAVRTKAMKCLSAVVEADPGILARIDMRKGVHGRFLDQSTSVREAAVELVGKFILSRPELTSQYYDMLSARILDTGISVRKRVIKIFRDICIGQPDFPKIPEMCVRMIRRVNDEEGIKKLVNDTFQAMWFTPHREKREDAQRRLIQRVVNITDVVSACKDSGSEWLEQLLENLLKKERDENSKPVEQACSQIVDCLVENVLKLEEGDSGDMNDGRGSATSRQVACFATLYLFCKVKPSLLVQHATTIQPYLNIRCITPGEQQVLLNVTRILELSVPLMTHPSESFLAQLEEDMMKLILKNGQLIVQSCVSCMGAVVNNVTHNYRLVRDCFQRFFGALCSLLKEHKKDPKNKSLAQNKPTLLRSLFTVGLLCKNFDFDSENFGEKKVCDNSPPQASIKDRVFDIIMYFMSHEDEAVRLKALTGIGFFCTRHYEFMLSKRLRDVYHDLLMDQDQSLQEQSHEHAQWVSTKVSSFRMKCQLLQNLQTYLVEEEQKMMYADAEWKKTHDKEDLKEMGDIQSGMASTVIQLYLKQVLESFFSPHSQVRLTALMVTTLILGQGLVHPVQCVPYLICMGSDCDSQIRIKADTQLQDIDKKYPGFIQMKALHGIKTSYRLQSLIQNQVLTRGVREEETPVALNNYIYSLIRSNRSHRRAVLGSLLNMFDENTRTPLDELLYIADNLAYFPYQLQDEPLYIIHQIDILVSVSGSNLIQSFHEIFYPGSTTEEGSKKYDEMDDEDVETLAVRVPEDASELIALEKVTQACALLLVLKQHLKDMYGFTDGKIHRYTSTDTGKTWDKALNRKPHVRFNPTKVLENLRAEPASTTNIDHNSRVELVEKYLEFKDLMLSIDPDDDEEDDDGKKARPPAAPAARPPAVTNPAAVPEATVTGGGGDLHNTSGHSGTNENADTSTEDVQVLGAGDAPQHISSSRDRSPRSSSSRRHTSHHYHHGSEKKRGRQSGGSSSSSRHKHHKSHKHKKKKKKRRISDSESNEDDSDSDPDFMG